MHKVGKSEQYQSSMNLSLFGDFYCTNQFVMITNHSRISSVGTECRLLDYRVGGCGFHSGPDQYLGF